MMRLLNILLLLYVCTTTVLSTVLFRTSLDSSLDLVFEADGGAEDRLEEDITKYGRSGQATKTNSCNQVRGLPQKLRYSSEMYPNGLTQFYQKYTEAYGIPVVSSSKVPEEALKRACYVLRFMMADHSGIMNNFYKRYGRVGVMATTEYTTDIPEHSWLDPVFWNARARGLGATEAWPISTGAEENILCYAHDQYAIEDIFLHEFAHGVHLLGAKYAISGWDARLRYWYNVIGRHRVLCGLILTLCQLQRNTSLRVCRVSLTLTRTRTLQTVFTMTSTREINCRDTTPNSLP